MNIFNQPLLGRFSFLKSIVIFITVSIFVSACGGNGIAPGETELPQDADAPVRELLVEKTDLPTITLRTPSKGVSVKPYFEWEAVEGASYFVLVVYDPEGKAYWSWQGKGNRIYLGGGDTPPPLDSAGPVLLSGMSWGVMAFNEEGILIGVSPRQSISP